MPNAGFRVIDAVVNPYTPEFAALRPDWSKEFLGGKVGVDRESLDGIPEGDFLKKLDRAGVERALLIAAKAGSTQQAIHYQIPYKNVARLVQRHPDRFSAIAGVDPTEGMRGVRELERAVKD